MRCKKHYTDLSSTVGVCASCLRERLFYLVTAQQQPQAQAQTLEENNCRRKTDNSASSTNNQHSSDRNRHHGFPDRRFFSSPQVAPITGSCNPCRKKQHSFIGFSLLSNLFRSKKRNEDSNSRSSASVSNHRRSRGGDDCAISVTSSPYSFSNIRSSGDGCRKKQPVCFSEASSTTSGAGVRRKQYCPDRGMSPVRNSDCGDAEDEFCDGFRGFEICESRKQTPWRTPVVRRGGGGGGNGKNVSGSSFCLSPLVRASPCRNWKQKGVVPVDCGEFRSPVKLHLYNTESFCPNRSRKVADFGRFATNR